MNVMVSSSTLFAEAAAETANIVGGSFLHF